MFARLFVFLLFAAVASAEPVPEMVVQTGHGDVVRAVALSPGGRLLASGGMDGAVILWEVSTGRQIRTLDGHSGGALALAFHPDDKTLFSGGRDRAVKRWNLDSGELVRTLMGEEPFAALSLSPDGAQVAAGSEDGNVYVWNAETGAPVRTFSAHSNGVFGLVFLPGGQLLSGGADGLVKVWSDTAAVHTLSGHAGSVTAVAVSPDGKRAASGSEDGTVKAWDLEADSLLWTAAHDQPVQAVAFAADGGTVLSGSWDGTVRRWAVATGEAVGRIEAEQIVGAVSAAVDGAVVSGGGENRITFWSADGKRLRQFEGQGSWVYGLAVNQTYLVAGSADGRARLWDLAEGRMLRVYDGHSAAVTSVALAPAGDRFVTGGGDGFVNVWDLASGECLHTLQEHEAWVYDVAVTPDGARAVSASADETIVVWDLASGKSLRLLEGHGGEVTSVTVTPDGRTLVSASGDETVRVWDLETGAEQKVLRGHSGWIFDVAVTPDGARAVTVSEDRTVRVWDLASGAQRYRIEPGVAVLSVAVSPDGKSATVGAMDGRLIRIDLESGHITGTSDGHANRVNAVAYGPEGTALYTASRDGSSRVRDTAGKERVSLIGFQNGDWLATTPEGFYNSSIDGGRYVAWRVGRQVFPFERYEETYRKPGVVRERLGGGFSSQAPPEPAVEPKPEPKPAPSALGAPPRIDLVEPASGLTTEEGKVALLLEASAGVDRLFVTVNGRPLQQEGKTEIRLPDAGPEQRVQMEVPLVYGANRIEATAINTRGVHSDPDTVTVVFPEPLNPVTGNLWVLVVGVSEHSNPRYSLTYPAVDATAIAQTLQEQSANLYGEVRVKVLVDRDSTTPGIQAALGEIAQQIGKEDVLVMFIAGHGARTKEGEYFFITHDTNLAKFRETALSWKDFEDLLRTMPARSVVLFADTCHSGDIVNPGSRFAGAEEMSHDLVKKSGVVVFVSSQGCEYSLESSAWGHGAFTYALLEALKGEANFQPDRVITMAELQLYVPTRVRRITQNKQHPRIPRLDNFDPEMPLVEVK